MLQATHFGRGGEYAFGASDSGVLALGEDSIFDKLKSFFTSTSSASTPQPPSIACGTGSNPDPSTGASRDAGGTCVCPFGTQWDDSSHRCLSTTTEAAPAEEAPSTAETSGSETLRSCIRTGFGVAFCVKNHPEISRDDIQIVFPALTTADINSLLNAAQAPAATTAVATGAPPIEISRICIRGAGSFASCTAGLSKPDIDQLAREFPQQAAVSKPVTASVVKKKFFDVKNPLMWAAIAGGVVVIGGGSYFIFRRKPAATAMSARRRRR